MSTAGVYELAGGAVALWLDESASIMLTVREPFGDPIELSEEEALELSAVLTRLAQDLRGG
jgi:hypothetical protein